MPWSEFILMLRAEYCPRDEIMRLEHEFWNMKMVGSEIKELTARHNELVVKCPGLLHLSTRGLSTTLLG